MAGVIIFFVLGTGLGFIIKPGRQKILWSNKISMFTVYILLFILGVTVGSNPQVLSDFKNLGLKALLISVLSLSGTLGATWLYYRFIFKSK